MDGKTEHPELAPLSWTSQKMGHGPREVSDGKTTTLHERREKIIVSGTISLPPRVCEGYHPHLLTRKGDSNLGGVGSCNPTLRGSSARGGLPVAFSILLA